MKPAALVVFAIMGATAGFVEASEVALLDGRLTMELPDGVSPDERKVNRKVIAGFKLKKSDAWGIVLRGTRGLEPEALGDYLANKTEEYTKDLAWLPKLTWLKKEMVTIHGRKWADLRFIGQMEKPKGPMDGMLYTRILATSYEGQLLEIVFTSNTDKDSGTKAKIDKILESVKLTE